LYNVGDGGFAFEIAALSVEFVADLAIAARIVSCALEVEYEQQLIVVVRMVAIVFCKYV
jgi:hypothetical protein